MEEKISKTNKNKDDKTIILYTNDSNEQHNFVSNAKDRGYDVLELSGPLVSHLISKIESKETNVQFARVDSDTIDKLIDKGDNNKSIDCFRKALVIKPDYHEALYNMGNAYIEKGDYVKSIECYKKALAIKPGDHEALCHMGIA